MISELIVPDEVVIGFFAAIVVSQTAAIAILWRHVIELEKRSPKD